MPTPTLPAGIGRPPSGYTHSTRFPVKVLVTGGFAVGKTTLITSACPVPALTTEVVMSLAARRLDDLAAVPAKTATTAAMDWTRVSLPTGVEVHLYGTPGQARFGFLWDGLRLGAVGALVLVDVRRFENSFAAVDYVERVGLPYAITVNQFPDAPMFAEADIRDALMVEASVPVLSCDARDRGDVQQVLHRLVRHFPAGILRRVTAQAPLPPRVFVPHTSPLQP